VTANYRNQWNGIANGFTTPGISADIRTGKNIGLGLNVMNQSAGNGGYNHLNGYLSIAYTGARFGKNQDQHLAIGISLGMINRRFDPSKFQTGEQWNPSTGYDPSGPTTDILSRTSASAFDAGAGLVFYDAAANKNANVFLGFSAFHLTQPEDPFTTSGQGQKLPVRYTGHGGIRFNLGNGVSFTPNLLYMRQGNAEEKMAGAYFQLRAGNSTDFLLGANYRFKDAVSPYVGLFYKNLVIGASYDVNTSDLSKMAGNANSFELSISFIGKRKHQPAESIPFVCPRL
jgi:type IX secretion system PorP/SprF family membrane protein